MVDIKILINGKDERYCVHEGTILNALIECGLNFSAPCGGNHKCHKCLINVLENNSVKTVLACSTQVSEGMKILLKEDLKFEKQCFDKSKTYYMCSDIGTTSLVFYLIDVDKKDVVYIKSFLNPQSIFGADVISRINYANNHGSYPLYKSINDVFRSFLDSFDGIKISKLFVSGNTTMLHLFINKNVKSLGEYPYTPLFLNKQILSGEEINLPVEEITLLPSFSSFVGADLAAGFYQTSLNKGNNLLIDLGTNGEIILHLNNKTYVTSTAAGPAFEGVGIECGCGGIDGAISKFSLVNGKIKYETINQLKPIGITGSGLISLISILKNIKIIDDDGTLKDKVFNICDNIYLTQKDVRSFQLAKSAVRTGIDILLDEANASIEELDHIYLAGGFGQHLDIESAINVGLLPVCPKDKIIYAGNTAGLGTIKYALNPNEQCLLDDISKKTIVIDLNSNKEFLDKFTDNMEI